MNDPQGPPQPEPIIRAFNDPVASSSQEPLGPRMRRLPARFRDLLPEPPVSTHAPPPPPSSVRRVFLHVFDTFRTQFNNFLIAREYRHRPTHDPDSFVHPNELSASSPFSLSSQRDIQVKHPPPWPWKNMSIWRLMNWTLTGNRQKSVTEVTRLVQDVLEAPDFRMEELEGFDARLETRRFDAAENALPTDDPLAMDKWKRTTVDIVVPTREKNLTGNGKSFTIEGFYYRPLLDVIRTVFAEPSSKCFHLTPFKKVGGFPRQKGSIHFIHSSKIWKSPLTGREQQVYDEVYTSDAWNQAQDAIMKQRRTDECKLERVVAGLMLWSDSTRLAQFAHVSAWPIYLFFGNQSKYARNTPERGACHPIAFIPPVGVHRTVPHYVPDSHYRSCLSRYASSYQFSRTKRPIPTCLRTANANLFTRSGGSYWMMSSSKHITMA